MATQTAQRDIPGTTKGRATRHRIIAAAADLMYRHGAAGTSTSALKMIFTGSDDAHDQEAAAQTSEAGIDSMVAVNFRGPVSSRQRSRRWAESMGEMLDTLAAASPLGRANEPDEVAHVIGYLAGEQARPITGTALAVDAGRVSTL